MLKSKFKYLGLGLKVNDQILDLSESFIQSFSTQSFIQWLEINPEDYLARGGSSQNKLNRIKALNLPIIPSCKSLSVGTAPTNKHSPHSDKILISYLKDFFKDINAHWFSDHLAVNRIDNTYFNELLPIPFTRESCKVVVDNINHLQDQFQIPFLLTNAYSLQDTEKNIYREFDFINEILNKTDCMLNLNISNLYANATNNLYDAKKFIDNINLNKLIQIQIGGITDHRKNKHYWPKIEVNNGNNISTPLKELLQRVCYTTNVKAICIHRENNVPQSNLILNSFLREFREIIDNKYDNSTPEIYGISAILNQA